jgi:hypothetical protein
MYYHNMCFVVFAQSSQCRSKSQFICQPNRHLRMLKHMAEANSAQRILRNMDIPTCILHCRLDDKNRGVPNLRGTGMVWTRVSALILDIRDSAVSWAGYFPRGGSFRAPHHIASLAFEPLYFQPHTHKMTPKEAAIQSAIADLESGVFTSQRQAANAYNISLSTLCSWLASQQPHATAYQH